MRFLITLLFSLIFLLSLQAQDYFYKDFGPFDPSIPSPEEFLGYSIGDYHTRHDRIVGYLETLSSASDRANLVDYGKTHEQRRLVILQISSSENLQNIAEHQRRHLTLIDPQANFNVKSLNDVPVFVNLAYNVHGNEPSGSEAALLSAYVLVASNHPDIQKYRAESIVFLDPTINPDGRDRHTQWVNSRMGSPLVADPLDVEHNEMWPRGRTNHYWFDLNRDWLLAVHPESQGKLNWYHQWYPNVVTDFHEMGTNSSYFFEPMKTNASKDPIMPEDNYTTLNEKFASYYQREMDKIGSLYFTKEVFDGTYPGYGSSYPDLQGGLGILFEQASSRGHLQNTPMGRLTFPYTIRNQFINAIATVEAAAENKELMHQYQQDFFKSAISNAEKGRVNSYIFKEEDDKTRRNAFLQLLLRHKIEVYPLSQNVSVEGQNYKATQAYVVPTHQAQYRMVQTMFETYSEYADSVYYDASAWSLANAYNLTYAPCKGNLNLGDKLEQSDLELSSKRVERSEYAYVISWNDYNAPGLLYNLQSKGINVKVAQKPFQLKIQSDVMDFTYGAMMIPLQKQAISSDSILSVLQTASSTWDIDIHSTSTGYSHSGIDLGSRYFRQVEDPKAIMLVGDGTSSYEVGFVWHLLDQRVKMPITKLKTSMFGRVDLSNYKTMVLVSGNYNNLDSADIDKIKTWIKDGNTLITIGRATSWAIKKKLVSASLIEKEKIKPDSTLSKRQDYVGASEIRGKSAVGGAIFEVDLDITHPIGYGYQNRRLPVYRNNSVWLKPSKNEFSNVAVYSKDPHIDGFISDDIMNKYLKKSASIIVSKEGRGRAILFAEDPNFRGTWYGTNKLFLNAIFFGDLIRVP